MKIYIHVSYFLLYKIVQRIILSMNLKNFNYQGKPRKIFIISAQEIRNVKASSARILLIFIHVYQKLL